MSKVKGTTQFIKATEALTEGMGKIGENLGKISEDVGKINEVTAKHGEALERLQRKVAPTIGNRAESFFKKIAIGTGLIAVPSTSAYVGYKANQYVNEAGDTDEKDKKITENTLSNIGSSFTDFFTKNQFGKIGGAIIGGSALLALGMMGGTVGAVIAGGLGLAGAVFLAGGLAPSGEQATSAASTPVAGAKAGNETAASPAKPVTLEPPVVAPVTPKANAPTPMQGRSGASPTP